MSDWAKVELSELLTLVIDHRGKTPKKMGFDDFFSKGYPVLSAKHIKNGDLVNLDNLRYGNNEMYKKWMKEEVKKEDIILTSEAPLGETYYIDNDQKYILGQRVFGLRANKEKVVPKYLEIWLSSLKGQQELFKRASGSTVQGIKQTELLKITVDIPPLEIQEKIATIGDSLSKKIKLNTQTNQTLEQIAQAIFKHWFIDFAPVHAKANALARGETIEQAELAAMACLSGKTAEKITALQHTAPEAYHQLQRTARAFPSEFVESEMGLVPKGWAGFTIKDCCKNLYNGGTPKRKINDYWDNGTIPWLSSGEVCNNNVLIQSKEFITEKGLANSSAKLVPIHSTLVAIYASPTAGKCSFCAFESTTNQAVCSLIPIDGFEYFNYLNLKTKEQYFANQAVGSAQQNISKKIIEDTLSLKPNNEIIRDFNLLMNPIFEKWIKNLKENSTLAKTRDELLPRLLSGEVEL
ncbi:restriction endonuclease subunit S [Gallibacterium anatis]|uniref:restriction endonuclease subunit S n=1 Tax=Gallibacterium anatis TaxID=750 RepID=UPI0030078C63